MSAGPGLPCKHARGRCREGIERILYLLNFAFLLDPSPLYPYLFAKDLPSVFLSPSIMWQALQRAEDPRTQQSIVLTLLHPVNFVRHVA